MSRERVAIGEAVPVRRLDPGVASLAVDESVSWARFPTTQWSRVARASDPADPEARAALEGLCRDYWYPLYAFVRRQGCGPEEAQDVVQGLFASLLERDDLAGLDPSRGKLRSFLMKCCGHYLAKHREGARTLKRGGGRAPISLDRLAAEERFSAEPSHGLTPERLFERRWALHLLDRVLTRLDEEMSQSGQRPLYEQLRPGLLGQEESPPYRQIAQALGRSEGSVKTAARRLRVRYRHLLRAEVARTVAEPGDVDAEVNALLAALAS
jgi:RNA polymerase sigma-70 factor (ECF subfamily)